MISTIFTILGFLIIAFAVFVLIAKSKIKNMASVENHQNILVLNDKNFQSELKGRTVLVDFWADWCVPCKMMAPILNEVSAELSENKFVAKANIEQYQILAQKYNVRSIPTMIMFKNGKEIERYVGVKQKNYLLEQFGKF